MPRLNTWLKAHLLPLLHPRPHKKLTTKDISISNPIPTSLTHWTPVLRTPPQPQSHWSLSAEDLLLPRHSHSHSATSSSSSSSTNTSSRPSGPPSLTHSHSRDSSDASSITIVVHSPPPPPAHPSTPPPHFFPEELPLPTRQMWTQHEHEKKTTHGPSTPLAASCAAAPVHTIVLLADASPVLFSETPSPTSYFKSAFEFDDGGDWMGAEGVLCEGEITDVRQRVESMGGGRRFSLAVGERWGYERI